VSEPRVTLVQVAARAGVSRTTAGYVLTGRDAQMRIADDTRHRVLRAAAEMNYRPNVMARSLRTTVQRPVAVLSDTLATEPWGGELLEGCLLEAARRGRLATVGETRRDPVLADALVEMFLNEQIETFVVASVYPREIELPSALRGCRVVMLNCASTDPAVPAVLPDEVEAGRQAGHLLLAQGLTDQVWLVGDRAPHVYAPGRDREQGLGEELGRAGLKVAAALDCAWEPEAAYEVIEAALQTRPTPSVLVCLNDRIAFGAYQALAGRRLAVPDDVAVLAFEASIVAEWLRPAVTSIDRPLRAMGRRAVELLFDEPQNGHELIPPTLHLRASTGVPQ
jgi:LacI family transcriptional regulator